MLRTDATRWHHSEAYLDTWRDRSAALVEILDTALSDAQELSFSEYGCGPNAPVATALAPSGRRCVRLDLKAWTTDCHIVDLNAQEIEVEPTDVATLCGVAEYLNDLPRTLRLLGRQHRYLLLSYYCLGGYSSFFQAQAIRQIDKRARVNGWRNHYTMSELVKCLSGIAFVLRVQRHRRQVLLLCEFCR